MIIYLNSSFFKIKFIIFLVFISSFIQAQNDSIWQVKSKIDIDRPLNISFDKKNQVYFSDKKGNIHQYSLEGEHLRSFAPQKLAEISILEAWQSIKIIAFYQNFQEFVILDRFFNPTSRQGFDFDLVEFAQVATLAFDDNIWLFDSGNFSLKKYNPITNQILVNTSLDLILNPRDYNINFIREYQNTLFLNDKNSGILVFDNLGNYKKLIPYPNLDYFAVWKDEIYFLQNNQLIFFHLYSFEQRILNLPQSEKWDFVLFFSEKLVLFSETQMCFFERR